MACLEGRNFTIRLYPQNGFKSWHDPAYGSIGASWGLCCYLNGNNKSLTQIAQYGDASPLMKNLALLALIASVAFALTGCASIFTGTTQTVQVNSTPSGANVSVCGLDRGQTPLPVVLKKGSSGQVVTLSLPGYQEKTFQPQTTFNPVAILNLWGILGWGIDAATGALWKYDPTFYNVQLQKVSKN